MSTKARMADILQNYRDGDEVGWVNEFAYLRTYHHERLANLAWDIRTNGQQEPIALGDDMRVWDGHHRLCVLQSFGFTEVDVTYIEQGDDALLGGGGA